LLIEIVNNMHYEYYPSMYERAREHMCICYKYHADGERNYY